MTKAAELVEAYLDSCRARGLAPKTVERAYALPLRQDFLPFLEREGVEDVAAIDQRVVDRFSTQLLAGGRSGRKLSPYSVAAYLRPVNQFLKWAAKNGAQASGSAQLPRKRRRELAVLTRAEIQALEDAAAHERDKVLIRLMADTGCRIGEVCNIKVEDVFAEDRRHYVRLNGKTGQRVAPVTPRLYGRLRALATYRRDTETDHLFVALQRRPGGRREALTVTGVYQAVKEAAARAELGKRVYPHILRHSAITHLISQEMNPVLTARITGVSLRVIEEVYAHPSLSDRHSAMMRALAGE